MTGLKSSSSGLQAAPHPSHPSPGCQISFPEMQWAFPGLQCSSCPAQTPRAALYKNPSSKMTFSLSSHAHWQHSLMIFPSEGLGRPQKWPPTQAHFFAPQWEAKTQFDIEENILFCQRGHKDLQVRKAWKCRCRWVVFQQCTEKAHLNKAQSAAANRKPNQICVKQLLALQTHFGTHSADKAFDTWSCNRAKLWAKEQRPLWEGQEAVLARSCQPHRQIPSSQHPVAWRTGRAFLHPSFC